MKDWRNDEIVDVQEDRRPWWAGRRLVIEWPVVLSTAVLAVIGLLRALVPHWPR